MKSKNNSVLSYAMSLTATWAWGTSLVVGTQIMQEKGLIPFLIFAIANSLSLPLFGYIAYRIPNLQKVVNSKIVMIFTTIVSIFCLWIQLNAIYQFLGNLDFVSTFVAKLIPIVIISIIALAMYKDGLLKNILLNNKLWYVCYGFLSLLLIYGFVFGVDKHIIVSYASSADIKWALNSCLILFSGPIMFLHYWQMSDKLKNENKMKAFYLAGPLFALYMAFVGCLAWFKFNGLMNIILVLVVICVASSTADSAVVGIQKSVGKKLAAIISIIAIIAWNWVIPMGVMGLWTTMGDMRKYVVAVCIIVAVVTYYIDKNKEKKKLNLKVKNE